MRTFVVEGSSTVAAFYERPANDEHETEVMIETRCPRAIVTAMLSKDEAIGLMEWLSEVTK